MTPRAPVPAAVAPVAYRQDDERRRDEARLVALQNQVDELRQAIREVLSRQARGEELFKTYESTVAQQRIALDQSRQEAQQTSQARALDENRTRQQLGDLEGRMEDAIRPIRSLQAHVAELIDASRKKTDDTGQHQKRYDELRSMIEHLAAHGDRTLVITHQLRDSLDLIRAETDGLRRDIIRAEDGIKIVDQEARRRIAEVAQVGQNFGARIDELRSDLAHLGDAIEDVGRSIVHIDPALEELRGVNAVLRGDVARFQAQAIERHDLLVERAEDVRQETDARFDEIRGSIEQRAERLAERIETAEDAHRDLGFKISGLAGQLDELRQVDATLRRDIWYLHEQRVRLRMEQIQAELDLVTDQRRDAVAPDRGGTRSRRPPGDDLDH
ncbi:MAG: hypothetical protein AVDCRST_MAG73-1672 [uncultured Thermomicrobiales bacterium]|uniref:Chromosome partition protein smc n=1 Tax=uncultured Thermomicrobiales bacterium TaxID=1645740 RepID=A0A6J4U1R3_9BACT|nr:MAG: hypothetical protein AVDCRST_MAG73-1672 [uncultured Thermomicrobiales bacterium]